MIYMSVGSPIRCHITVLETLSQSVFASVLRTVKFVPDPIQGMLKPHHYINQTCQISLFSI